MTDLAAFSPPPLLPPLPPPLPAGPPPLPGLVRFIGPEWAYWRLRIKGAVLLLFAIGILVPIYVAIAMASLALEVPDYVSAPGGLALLAVFGEFARYRARRYRLTRTVFRGLRFHQDGSGWLYAFYAMLWWILIIVSLGLAYPWAEANLQRYMMRHTSYGKLPGRFEGSGWRLFLRGLPLWLASVGPLLVAAGYVAAQVDWQAFGAEPQEAEDGVFDAIGADLVGKLGVKTLAAIGIGGVAGSVLAAILLYPVFQAIVYRWWLSGLRFGDVTVTSRLRIGQVYLIYLRYIGIFWLFTIGASIGVGILAAVFFALLKAFHIAGNQIPGHDVIGAGIGVLSYAAFALAVSVMHQVLISFALWRAAAQSAEISNAPTLDTVEAKAGFSSALGEGLVDALGFGSV
jgi:uncharacterized membrane protein YjgN (DUF898 family)